jgi:murein DD-endopeptidase MepM/ murein hydrolase activator NlpD
MPTTAKKQKKPVLVTQQKCKQDLQQQVSYCTPMLSRCLPTLSPLNAYINLEQAIGPLAREKLILPHLPKTYQLAIDGLHKTHSIEWSYGGWLEDRAKLWQNTYITYSGKTLHVGLDINAPYKTPVHSPGRGKVKKIDYDSDGEIDWGTSIAIEYGSYTLIFAHLSKKIHVQEGQVVQEKQQIGEIGIWPENGNVFTHLHIQSMRARTYETLLQNNLQTIDGYVKPGEKHEYLDPIKTLEKIKYAQ